MNFAQAYSRRFFFLYKRILPEIRKINQRKKVILITKSLIKLGA